MRKLILIVLFSLLSIVPSYYAWAHTESGPVKCAVMKFEKEFERSKAVFVGKVLSVQKEGNTKIFEFQVRKYWKGIDRKRVKITGRENPRYQAQFKVDGEFLVFAKGDDKGKLWDGRCSRSKDMAGYGGAVEEDLKKLGKAKTCISLVE